MWFYLLTIKDSLIGKVWGKTLFPMRNASMGPLLQRSPPKSKNRNSQEEFDLITFGNSLKFRWDPNRYTLRGLQKKVGWLDQWQRICETLNREKLLENIGVKAAMELGILKTDKLFSSSKNISLLLCPYVVFLIARNLLFTGELLTYFFEEF